MRDTIKITRNRRVRKDRQKVSSAAHKRERIERSQKRVKEGMEDTVTVMSGSRGGACRLGEGLVVERVLV